MTARKRAFYFKETANSLVLQGPTTMNLFHSLLLVIAEIALGLSLLVFVGAALAAYSQKFR